MRPLNINEPNWNFLDLMKDYDILNNEVLLSKLNSYSISGTWNYGLNPTYHTGYNVWR
jgi:hypothetical protein